MLSIIFNMLTNIPKQWKLHSEKSEPTEDFLANLRPSVSFLSFSNVKEACQNDLQKYKIQINCHKNPNVH